MLEIPEGGLPVTIITGFLGSGKTTLLNQILENKQNLKVAILVNEFGDINIDSQLLVSYEDDIVELSNGCICCTINEGLVKAVRRILERVDLLDCLIIETTGIADPLPIVLTFVGSEFRNFTRLDSVLTIIDAANFTPEHFDSEAALKQITFADILLLNKTDLVDKEKITELEKYLLSIKKDARIIQTQYARVQLPLILDVSLTQEDNYLEEEKERDRHSHHLVNDGFVSVSFQSDRPFDVYKFQKFLSEQLPKEVFRAKGIIWFSGSKLRHIFQLIGRRNELKSEPWSTSPANQLVFIGRHLDTDFLIKQLNDCLTISVTV